MIRGKCFILVVGVVKQDNMLRRIIHITEADQGFVFPDNQVMNLPEGILGLFVTSFEPGVGNSIIWKYKNPCKLHADLISPTNQLQPMTRTQRWMGWSTPLCHLECI